MNATRASCSVLTCDRDMPAGQVMCAWCWSKVPKDLRRKMDGTRFDAGRQRRELERQAISAAQAAS
ncbi:MAG: hypothetical protein Q8M19_17225 [Reyranella sp.]|nr:hypothetical protein [Reyranella sp.]